MTRTVTDRSGAAVIVASREVVMLIRCRPVRSISGRSALRLHTSPRNSLPHVDRVSTGEMTSIRAAASRGCGLGQAVLLYRQLDWLDARISACWLVSTTVPQPVVVGPLHGA